MLSSHVVMNGALVAKAQATVSVDTPAFRYGAMVFEGIRVYADDAGRLHCFRHLDHLTRLRDSMRVLRFLPVPSLAELDSLLLGSLEQLEVDHDAHVRVMVYVDGSGPMWDSGPLGTVVMATSITSSLPGCREARGWITSWRRIDGAAMPPRVKSAANYQNSRLGVLEARAAGADVALFLDRDGRLTEAHGSCVLVVRHGTVATPTRTSGILESVTRDTLLTLLRDEGVEVEERDIDRIELTNADELILCGSMAEVTALTAVGDVELPGGAGPVAGLLGARYEDVVRARHPRSTDWCTPLAR